jgi:hypothetical protein
MDEMRWDEKEEFLYAKVIISSSSPPPQAKVINYLGC